VLRRKKERVGLRQKQQKNTLQARVAWDRTYKKKKQTRQEYECAKERGGKPTPRPISILLELSAMNKKVIMGLSTT